MKLESGTLEQVWVWRGAELAPTPCRRLEWTQEGVVNIEPGEEGACRWGVVPGFVNAHTHIGDAFLPEAAVTRTLEEAFFRPQGYKYRMLETIAAEEHIRHMVDFHQGMAASGTVAHVDFREQGAEGARRLREASSRSGVRAFILNQFANPPQTPESLGDPNLPLSESAEQELREMLAVADGFSESTMNDLTDAAWRDVQRITEKQNKARAVHCLESWAYRDISRARTGKGDLVRALELLQPDLVVHLTVAHEEEIQLLAASGVPAVLNVRANAALGLPLPPVAALLEAGVPLLLGTDNGILNGPDLFRELDAVYRLACSQAGEDHRPLPADILKMVTSTFANTRWGNEFPGILEVGMPSTFSVVDLSASHFQRSSDLTATLLTRASPADVVMTVSHGKVIYRRETSS